MASEQSRDRASINDVARRAGVAVGTVSNVLNRPEIVAAATRERVLAAITELSFVPNRVARRLRTGTITAVGAILLDIRNPFFTEVARGIEDRLAVEDFTLMLASSDDDPAREARYLRLFEEHGVVGVLVVPTGRQIDHLLATRARGVQVVVLDAPSSTPELSSVSVDDVAGGRMAASHLLGRGHRRLTFLNGSHAYRQCADRRVGVDHAVVAAGLDPALVVAEVTLPQMSSAAGEVAMRGLIEAGGGRPPGAVLCVNDLVAVGVQRALRLAGGTALLRSTAVVGYDDLDIASELAVPLTSVRQPALEVGRRATDLLLRARDDTTVTHVVLQPELVVRASSEIDPPGSADAT